MALRFTKCLLSGLLMSGFTAGPLWAQGYPARPVQLIVPFAPGGSIDFVARLTGTKLGEGLGQPVVIVNRDGAGGTIGANAAARSAPDGYTLTIGINSTHVLGPVFNSKIPYNALTDFTPISIIASSPQLLLTGASQPSKSLKELVALAKAQPGKLNFGSSGIGGDSHLAGELLKHTTGINLVHVPYKGNSMNALAGGEIQVQFSGIVGGIPLIQAGRLRALAITGIKRSESLPDVPTFREQGIAGFDEASQRYLLLGPAGLQPAVVQRLNREMQRVVANADFKAKMLPTGAEPVGSSAEEAAEGMRNAIATWTRLVKETGLKVSDD